MKRMNKTDARIMIVKTVPRQKTPPTLEDVTVDRRLDWQRSILYEEILQEKDLKYYKDCYGFIQLGTSPNETEDEPPRLQSAQIMYRDEVAKDFKIEELEYFI